MDPFLRYIHFPSFDACNSIFLYQAKGDPKRAEEYYSRAILADPGDGEILSRYAKLVWELHHDEERASGYFEQAIQATPNDRYIYMYIYSTYT